MNQSCKLSNEFVDELGNSLKENTTLEEIDLYVAPFI